MTDWSKILDKGKALRRDFAKSEELDPEVFWAVRSVTDRHE